MKPRAVLAAQTCTYCGKGFGVSIESWRYRHSKKLFCNHACRTAYAVRECSTNWRGGRHIDPHSGFVMLRLPLGTKGKAYRSEHRLIVEHLLGRRLLREECILHLDGRPTNNTLGNLYVCRSRKEMLQYARGLAIWPIQGNLAGYE